MNGLKLALIISAGIVVVFLLLFAIAGFGSVESSIGQFLKDTLPGTAVEDAATSLEDAGNHHSSWAKGAITIFTGMLILTGLMWIGANSKH